MKPRESVWISTKIRRAPEFRAISMGAVGLWVELLFCIAVDADDNHVMAEVSTDAPPEEVEQLRDELEAAGFIEPWHWAYRMTPLSRRFYSFTEPVDEEDEA